MNKKLGFHFFFGLMILCLSTACATRSKNLSSADGTLEEAEFLMKDEFYEEARTQFLRIKTEFPESPLQATADLRIADSYFKEESFAAAADSYEDFIRTYPRHEQVPYALYQMGLSFVKRMPSNPQRDNRSTQRAVDTFTRLLVDHPDSEYSAQALETIERAQNLMAERIYAIARFYEKKKKNEAAATRFGELVELYPEHQLAEESLARQIKALQRSGKDSEAQSKMELFKTRYPESNLEDKIGE